MGERRRPDRSCSPAMAVRRSSRARRRPDRRVARWGSDGGGVVQASVSWAGPCEDPSVVRLAERSPDVLVVGAGAAGLACALYAGRRGLSVEVLDAGEVGQGASFGNAGLVPVSATTPLAGPGAVSPALRWLVDPDGAFRLRPRPSAVTRPLAGRVQAPVRRPGRPSGQ